MDLATMRALVRRDLHDEDASNYRWTNDEIDRHIARAVKELSLAAPLSSQATLTTTEGSRDLSLASLTGLVAVEAVEYPVGQYPPSYAPFSVWADTLTLLVDAAPLAARRTPAVTPTARCLGRMMASTPNTSAVRRIPPRF